MSERIIEASIAINTPTISAKNPNDNSGFFTIAITIRIKILIGIHSQAIMIHSLVCLLCLANGFPRCFIDKTFLLKTIPHTNSISPEMPIASKANIP